MNKKGILWTGLGIVLFFVLLGAVFLFGEDFRNVPEEGEISGDETTVLIDPALTLPEPVERVEYEYGGYGVSLPRFDGWEYQIEEYGEEKTYYGIRICPESADGKISVFYHTAFGVCGTGLREKDATLGPYDVRVGTYYDAPIWDFIVIRDPEISGRFVILREGDLPWWDVRGEEVMRILNSLQILVPDEK